MINERDRFEVWVRGTVESLVHQSAVIEEGGGVEPLRRARKRRETPARVKWRREGLVAGIQALVEIGKPGREPIPVLESLEQ